MKLKIAGLALCILLPAIAGCTTNLSTTASSTNQYTAWACLPHTHNADQCADYIYAVASSETQAVNDALSLCGKNCRLIWAKKGCVPIHNQQTDRHWHPECS